MPLRKSYAWQVDDGMVYDQDDPHFHYHVDNENFRWSFEESVAQAVDVQQPDEPDDSPVVAIASWRKSK